MRTDLVIGLMISLAFHGALLTAKTAKPPVYTIPPPTTEERPPIEMPLIPPDPQEEPVEELRDETTPQLAPPSLVDLPSPELGAFAMPIQPPPPPGLPTGDIANVPVHRNYGPPVRGLPRIFDPRDLEQQPALTGPVQPVYPMQERRDGIAGNVTVEFIVTSSGRTTGATIVNSTHRAFERPALDAVAKWQFRAGRKGGRAVNTRVQQLIAFNLND